MEIVVVVKHSPRLTWNIIDLLLFIGLTMQKVEVRDHQL